MTFFSSHVFDSFDVSRCEYEPRSSVSTIAGSEKTADCRTDANICETRVEQQRDMWKINPAGASFEFSSANASTEIDRDAPGFCRRMRCMDWSKKGSSSPSSATLHRSITS